MEHKRTTLKSLQHDTAKKIERKRKQVEMLEKKYKDAKKEMIELQRKSRDLEGLETSHENDHPPEDYTEWARKTVKEALPKAKPYGPSFTYRVVLEMLEHYLDKGGNIRPGVGMKFPTDHKEKPIYDFATPSLEALGFHIHHIKLPIPDRYVYFVTKYE